jgi:hypothetical protein
MTVSEEQKMKPLPVAGYTTQGQLALLMVNTNKELEEKVLRRLDELQAAVDRFDASIDAAMLAAGRSRIIEAFMWVNRAIFQPTRVRLPEDE